jgi:oxalate decarboxylase
VVRKNFRHYVENTGSDVLQFIEMFRASRYEEVSHAESLGHVPPELIMQHFNLTRKRS